MARKYALIGLKVYVCDCIHVCACVCECMLMLVLVNECACLCLLEQVRECVHVWSCVSVSVVSVCAHDACDCMMCVIVLRRVCTTFVCNTDRWRTTPKGAESDREVPRRYNTRSRRRREYPDRKTKQTHTPGLSKSDNTHYVIQCQESINSHSDSETHRFT